MRARSLVCLLLLASLAATAPAAAASPKITFYFGLERPEAGARKAFFAVSDPASPSYRRFASAASVGDRFGASAATRRAFRRAAEHHGLRARIDPTGVFARVTARVRRLERVLGVTIQRRFTNGPNAHFWLIPHNGAPHLPADMAPHVREVVAFDERSATGAGDSGTGRRTRAAQRGSLDRRLPQGTGDEGLRLRAGPSRIRARRRRHGRRRLRGAAERGRRGAQPRPGRVRALLRAAAAADPRR